MPHVLAYALMQSIPTQHLEYGGQGLKDSTRIAASSPQVWSDICMSNSKNILHGLDELVKNLVSRIMQEAKEMGQKMGLPIEQTPEDRHLVTAKLGAFKTSMLQDFEAKRALELDALIGAVHEMSRWLEHPSPYMDALFGLSRLHARVHGLYK